MIDTMLGIKVSTNQIRNITNETGKELQQARDRKTEAYWRKPIPEHCSTKPATLIPLATISIDGGRVQTRDEGAGPGVQHPHWRESKNAVFLRMSRVSFSEDPCPELPACFARRDYMQALLSDVDTDHNSQPTGQCSKSDLKSWRPEILYRTCLSSLCDSTNFGRMMEAEADSRGFYHAEKKAFVADGLSYNWTIHQQHFSDFTPIVDFIHVLEHLYNAAKTICETSEDRWKTYVEWATDCWQGNVASVIQELENHRASLGAAPEDADENHPSAILQAEVGYLRNNEPRMNYSQYRTLGLPITSAHMESYVKEINQRVKASDKFWNDGDTAENILVLKAVMLSDTDPLRRHMQTRPGRVFNRNIRRARAPAMAG